MKEENNFHLKIYVVILCIFVVSFTTEGDEYFPALSSNGIDFSINCFDKLIGEYRYCLNEREDVSQCYTLIINCKEKQTSGLIFGPRPDPDHGMYYFLSKIKKIQLTDSLVEFNFAFDNIYNFPVTKHNYTHLKDSIGGAESTRIQLKGVLRESTINVSCEKCEGERDFTSMKFRKE